MNKLIRSFLILSLTATLPLAFAGEKDQACDKPCDKTTKTAAACDKTTKTAAACDKSKVQTVSLQIGGLDCEVSCANFEKTVAALKGVSKHATCTKSKKTSIAFDSTRINRKQILAAIQKAGYTVKAEELKVSVEGLKCAGCVSKVDQSLASLEGMISKEVCHESKTATVAFNPAKLDAEKVLAAIQSTGFQASPVAIKFPSESEE